MRITLQITGLFMFLLLAHVALADIPDSRETADDLFHEIVIPAESDAEASVIDEVTVVEQKGISQLRFELAKADDRVFSLYNTLNSNKSLDVVCKKETRIGSQIKYRVCKTFYHRQIEGEAASDFLEGIDPSTSARAPAGHYEEVRTNMANLMAEHPELLRAVRQRADLRKRISDQKEED